MSRSPRYKMRLNNNYIKLNHALMKVLRLTDESFAHQELTPDGKWLITFSTEMLDCKHNLETNYLIENDKFPTLIVFKDCILNCKKIDKKTVEIISLDFKLNQKLNKKEVKIRR